MIRKNCFLLLLILFNVPSLAHDANYYKMNPNRLEKALLNCPTQSPTGITCDQLREIEMSVNQLATELRIDPQAYGQSILTMQQTIAQQIALNEQQSTPELTLQLAKNQQILRERLSIVKWLESPVSH